MPRLTGVGLFVCVFMCVTVTEFFFFQAEDGIRDLVRSRGLGDVYKRQEMDRDENVLIAPRRHERTPASLNGHGLVRREGFCPDREDGCICTELMA